ncbi:hypothetical protein [Psychroserpens sp.]
MGCDNSEEITTYLIDINQTIPVSERVSTDPNSDLLIFQQTGELHIDDEYTLREIELLTSNYSIFPYQSEIIDVGIEDYALMIQNLFDSLGNNDLMEGISSHFFGLKAKLIITLENETSLIVCEFHQDENEDIVLLYLEYVDFGVPTQRFMSRTSLSEIFEEVESIIK